MSRSNIPERVKSYQFAQRRNRSKGPNPKRKGKNVTFSKKTIHPTRQSGSTHNLTSNNSRMWDAESLPVDKKMTRRDSAILFGKGRNSAAERRLKAKEKEIQNSWSKWLTHGVGNVAEACTGSRCGLGGGKTRKNNKKKYKKHTKKHKKTKRKRNRKSQRKK
jgi:hypothetical protein